MSWFGRKSSPAKLVAKGERAFDSGDFTGGLDYLRRAISEYRNLADFRAAASLGQYTGRELQAAQDWEASCEFLEGAITDWFLASSQPDPGVSQGVLVEVALLNVAGCEHLLGFSLKMLEQYPKAIRNLRKAARCFAVNHREKEAGDSYLMWGTALRDYGFATQRERLLVMAARKFETAGTWFKDAIRWKEEGGEQGLVQCFLSSRSALFALGRVQEVIDTYPEIQKLARDYGDTYMQTECERAFQEALAEQAHPHFTEAFHAQSLAAEGPTATVPTPNVYTGSGDSILDIEKPDDEVLIYVRGNSASRHFGVTGYGADGECTGLFVHTSLRPQPDPYEGVRPLDFMQGQETTRLEIDASGRWQIEIRSLRSARTVEAGDIIKGDGDDVFLIKGSPDAAVIEGNAAGRNFAVTAYGTSADILVNTVDPYVGVVMMPPDSSVVEVTTIGPWEVRLHA